MPNTRRPDPDLSWLHLLMRDNYFDEIAESKLLKAGETLGTIANTVVRELDAI